MLLLILGLLTLLRPGPDPEWERVADLRGPWRFHLGDDLDRARADYDDKAWESIFVPSTWEDEGFWGYDGVAWYRKPFTLADRDLRQPLYLRLGRIDDVDQVWVNGHFVGSTGRFLGMEYETAYFAHRVYRVPAEYLRSGTNVVAVRVYDEGLEGGIIEGEVGVYALTNGPELAVDLAGTWDFRPEDAGAQGAPERGWVPVTVPAKWEPQGFPHLDGYAWYRQTVILPRDLRDERLVLILGRIDDLHEVSFNGQPVGGSGAMESRRVRGSEWQQLRVYRLDDVPLYDKNRLLVRVYDAGYEGGIYEGPVGVMAEGAYERWRTGGSVFERLRGLFRLGD